MIKIYTASNSNSSRNAKEFLDSYGIEYEEQNIRKDKLTLEQLKEIFHRADDMNDIISTRANTYKGLELLLDNEDTKMSEVYSYILNNPTVLKVPIIMDENRFEVGCGEDIFTFVPKHIREQEIDKILEVI